MSASTKARWTCCRSPGSSESPRTSASSGCRNQSACAVELDDSGADRFSDAVVDGVDSDTRCGCHVTQQVVGDRSTGNGEKPGEVASGGPASRAIAPGERYGGPRGHHQEGAERREVRSDQQFCEVGIPARYGADVGHQLVRRRSSEEHGHLLPDILDVSRCKGISASPGSRRRSASHELSACPSPRSSSR